MADTGNFTVFNLGSQRIGAAVFTKSRSGELVLKRFDFAELLGDPSLEATRLPQLRVAVVELAEKLKLKGTPAWYAIAGHVVFTRFVKLPTFDDEKADQIVEFEARQNVPFPINEVIWDYEFIDTGDPAEREVALVAIRADGLNDINEQIESVGVQVSGVDLAPLAAYNAFRYCYPDVDESALIIDLGARSTNLIFSEGRKVFTRNILVGGSTITGAISKELGVPFGEAEELKRTKGYVAPGGAYEPNEDETVDAVSKIMRNTMTRLHGEVVRTINYYRSQQQGSAPRRIFLCGGGSQTPLVQDFFQEKFNLPVEIFNSLRGIQLDRKVNEEHAKAAAGSLAELVGLALRHAGAAPVEVELVPETVAKRRDAAQRAPFLIMGGLTLAAALGVSIFYFNSAQKAVDNKVTSLKATHSELQGYANQLKEIDRSLDEERNRSAQLEAAVSDRGYWDHLLSELNNKFENDYIWLTQIQVLKNGVPISPSPGGGTNVVNRPTPPPPASNVRGNAKAMPVAPTYVLEVRGLYRKNEAGGANVVYKYYEALKGLTDLFGPTDEKADASLGAEEDRYAYPFSFKLPLLPKMSFDKK